MNKIYHYSGVRYVLVGLVNTACGVGSMMLLLHGLNCGYWTSTLLGNGMAMIFSYLINSKWTFQTKRRNGTRLFLFLVVSLLAYGVSYSVSLLLGNLFLYPLSFVKTMSALIGSGLYTISGYLGHRFITFR